VNPEKTKYMSEGKTEAEHKESELFLWICGKVQIFGNNTNR
jgi:hypothetical protein